jgi:hypothetical protein
MEVEVELVVEFLLEEGREETDQKVELHEPGEGSSSVTIIRFQPCKTIR